MGSTSNKDAVFRYEDRLVILTMEGEEIIEWENSEFLRQSILARCTPHSFEDILETIPHTNSIIIYEEIQILYELDNQPSLRPDERLNIDNINDISSNAYIRNLLQGFQYFTNINIGGKESYLLLIPEGLNELLTALNKINYIIKMERKNI